MADAHFYRAFEDRHRGSRELIKSRLEIYLPFVAPLKLLYIAPEALDLGCGRGEWLELVQHSGFQAKGVDLDEGMLLACRELGLNIAQADALEYIKGLATDSLSVVSAFHVVEHISFDVLRELVDEAHRVLIPGGLLILETPNPENLVVGTSNFYLDPTHQRPLPAQLLSFVVEFAGFGRVKTLYLQESPDLVTSQKISLNNVLNGVSPDYAVVAQKKASAEICALFDAPFNCLYGISLSALAERYDQQAEARATQAETRVTQAETRVTQAETRVTQAETRVTQAEARATQAETRVTQAEARATQAEVQFHNVLSSRSWRITSPIRWLSASCRREYKKLGELSQTIARNQAIARNIGRLLTRLQRIGLVRKITNKFRFRFPWLWGVLLKRVRPFYLAYQANIIYNSEVASFKDIAVFNDRWWQKKLLRKRAYNSYLISSGVMNNCPVVDPAVILERISRYTACHNH